MHSLIKVTQVLVKPVQEIVTMQTPWNKNRPKCWLFEGVMDDSTEMLILCVLIGTILV